MTRPATRGRGRAGVRLRAAGDLAWQEHALCATAEDVFFSDDQRFRAKAVCGLCRVWQPCLNYGMDEEHGVWGGLTRSERARLGRLRERLGTSPQDPQNARDVHRLIRGAGLSTERLATVLGVEPDTVEALLDAADAAKTRDARDLGLAS